MSYFVCARTGEEFSCAEEWLEHLKRCGYCDEVIKLTFEELYPDSEAVK